MLSLQIKEGFGLYTIIVPLHFFIGAWPLALSIKVIERR